MARLAPTPARPLRRTATVALLTATAAATVLTVAAAPAEAATARSLGLTFTATSALTSGSVRVSGILSHSPKATSIAVQRLSGHTWKTVRTAKSTAAGRFSTTAPMPGTAGTYSFRAHVAAKGKLRAATSRTTKVTVRRHVTATLTPATSSVRTGARIALGTRVTPFLRGAHVTLQRASGSTWVTAATGVLTASGTAAFAPAAPTTAGTYTYRVSSPASSTLTAAVSPSARVVVSVPPSPAPPTTPVITTTTLPAGTVGTAYATTLATSGNVAGAWSVVPGSTSPFSLNPTTGALTGTPAAPGDLGFSVEFTATASGLTATAALSVHIDPAPVAPPAAQTLVSAGDSHTCRITTTHTLWCWGSNDKGQLGEQFTLSHPYEVAPTQVGTATNWTTVSAGLYDTCGVRADYTLWCWGYNANGEDGNGTTQEQVTPVQAGAALHWTSVSVGDYHTCGITTAATMYCWGQNAGGALGTAPTQNEVHVPTQVGTGANWRSVDIGGSTSCAITTANALWCWGGGYRGQLGTGTPGTEPAPVAVGTSASWATVSVGPATVCATRTDGTAWCWGRNDTGQVGDGTRGTDRTVPTQVGVASTWAALTTNGATNAGHTCGVRTDNTLWCWGDNSYGAIGDGTTTERDAPVQVGTATDWTSVSAGGDHTCGVRTDGSQWCWGSDDLGQLGLNGSRSVNVPVPTRLTS